MKIATRAVLLTCVAGLFAGCGSTAATSGHHDPDKRQQPSKASSSSAPTPASQVDLIAQARAVLAQSPASRQVLTQGLEAQNPTTAAAEVDAAVQQMKINWNRQALKAVKVTMHGGTGTTPWLLANALTSEGHFTAKQANWAVQHSGVDWNKQATMGFQHILDISDGWSRAALIQHVITTDHYTNAMATYAADHVQVDWNKQALKTAKAHAPGTRSGVEHTLTGRGFTLAQADYAADALGYYTAGQENAMESAQQYLDMQGFSRLGLIDQLSSSYGDGYSVADATFAVDHIKVDWNAEAVKAAKAYLDMEGFSRQGLIGQLSSSYGDKFTLAQATYAANHVGL
jgi:hypothetical protein